MDLGLDSLMAVELRDRLASWIGSTTPLPATCMFDYPTIEAIAQYIGRGFESRTASAVGSVAEDEGVPGLSATAARIADLSEEETEALLLEQLENLQR